MPETPQEPRHKFSALTTLAAVLAAFLLAAAAYVCWQAAHILFPQNVYETALPITISDTIEADGVLLFDETCISGSGNLGYLVADGERVSAGTAVAELYTDANQAVLRQQLTQLTSQIDLLQRSQNTAATQLDGLLKERSGALYDLLDALDVRGEGSDDDALFAALEKLVELLRVFRRTGAGSGAFMALTTHLVLPGCGWYFPKNRPAQEKIQLDKKIFFDFFEES